MMAKPESDYDVVVAGGGAGGVGAALGAAQSGARVLLVEKYGFLGGAATNAQVLAYCGFYQQGPEPIKVVGGVADLVLDELRNLGLDCAPFQSPTTLNWIILLEPEAVKLALDRVLAAQGVDVLLHTRVAAVTRTSDRIEAVTLAGMDGRTRVVAEAFVDATGDANLSLVAGIPCRTGDTNGNLQAISAPIRIAGRDRSQPIDREAIKAAFARYRRNGRWPSARDDGGIYTEVPNTGEMWWMMFDHPMPDLSSASFSTAERAAREAAHDYVAVLRSDVPGFENAYLVQTGPQIGIRESRHPAARYELTGEDIATGRQRDDEVAKAAWPMEDHTVPGQPIYTPVGGTGCASIPLDALRAKGVDNLYFAGRTIGADPMAYASIRVMGTAFATGEAAGRAAAAPGQVRDTQQEWRKLG
ncbi:FAD-dependent oxidoreductase [Phaeobacter gallaeciensis]|uniref:FAD-dependent oxidoreductase n=1 Tax=Phaeobacter gallaeciensis TaxID=60890 RepID=UPI00237FF6F2|nr:FAD-dependent oxidoreductase [Phaeobacter gallaeciensis]MDE4275033.1 FAD-dependent oxidoreductase [Phaeobacter gallaeciensis]MDE4300050.1 FAD-dependent oxidoreductase [Phaeobacter gallaeciensis]MDE5185214.1 FAD-dependent oxidoreductase [Phaeobacter gallaeciensis]